MPEDPTAADRLLAALDGCTEPPVAIAVGVARDGDIATATSRATVADRFELGSITKTMTAQVLASLVLDGIVTLDDPVGRWLDAGPNGAISLGQLATHTSGLPRMPANADAGDGFDPLDPYAAYTAELAEAALRDSQLKGDGTSAYSNFGYQVLGLALERAAGTQLADLFDEHVFAPFGLATASVGPHPDQVQGFREGEPTPAWRLLLPGPGGVVGTAADLVTWGRAVAEPPAGRHGDALRLALEPRVEGGAGHVGAHVGLAWHRTNGLVWHNGGTYGFRTCLAVDPVNRRVAASLVATRDLDHVDQATFLAADGRDPVDARPSPAGDEHHAPALALITALVAHDWAGAQAAMSDECRTSLTAERLSGAWWQIMDPRGTHTGSTVRAAVHRGPVTEVTVDLAFVDGEGWAKAMFSDDGSVVGLLIG